jgi:hypothetical protein
MLITACTPVCVSLSVKEYPVIASSLDMCTGVVQCLHVLGKGDSKKISSLCLGTYIEADEEKSYSCFDIFSPPFDGACSIGALVFVPWQKNVFMPEATNEPPFSSFTLWSLVNPCPLSAAPN